jgi:hypothetical protein
MMVVSEWAGRVDEQGMAWLYQDSGQLENIDILNTETEQKIIILMSVYQHQTMWYIFQTGNEFTEN